VNSTTQVCLKGENETGYNVYNGSSGISHVVTVENLTRNEWYIFYVVSSSSHGTAVSEQRDIFIDNGITFDKRTYNFNIERDYDQRATISVTNTDDKPHDLLLTVNNPYEDLIVGFIGDGSMDTVVTLNPSERKYVTLAIHAQDVLQEAHKLLLNLTNMGEENIHDFAYANVHVHIPHYDFTLEEVSSDPYTLTKTLQIKNHGDTVTDFSVSASDELKDKIVFQPAINHLRLRTGEMVEFDAIPALSEDFAGMNGTILVQGADQMVNSSADFALPLGKRVFVGHASEYVEQILNKTPEINATFDVIELTENRFHIVETLNDTNETADFICEVTDNVAYEPTEFEKELESETGIGMYNYSIDCRFHDSKRIIIIKFITSEDILPLINETTSRQSPYSESIVEGETKYMEVILKMETSEDFCLPIVSNKDFQNSLDCLKKQGKISCEDHETFSRITQLQSELCNRYLKGDLVEIQKKLLNLVQMVGNFGHQLVLYVTTLLDDVVDDMFDDPGLGSEASTSDWFCNNRPHIQSDFDLSPDICPDDVSDCSTYLITHFTLPWDRMMWR
jgi:hypothetical protein